MSTIGLKLNPKYLEKCIHHWVIDRKDYGKCIKCGEEKDFAPDIDKYESKLFIWNMNEELL